MYDNALNTASSRGHLAVVTVLLDAGANQHLGSSLTRSATGGHTAVAALLLDRGADVHYGQDLPLQTAARGHLETVRLLLDHGANAQNEMALRQARRYGQDAIVALLMERGAVAL